MYNPRRWLILAAVLGFHLTSSMTTAGETLFEQQDLFVSGQGGYHTYRIPALVVSRKGTVLAFCEGRKNSAADHGNIDLLVRRSFDGGKTWPCPRMGRYSASTSAASDMHMRKSVWRGLTGAGSSRASTYPAHTLQPRRRPISDAVVPAHAAYRAAVW